MRRAPLIARHLAALALVVVAAASVLATVDAAPAGAATPAGQSCDSYVRALPSGGRSLVVAQDGSGNFKTVNAAAQAATAGDVVTIKNGTYAESVTLTGAGTSASPIVFQADTCGQVTLTGAGNSFRGNGFVANQAPQTANAYVTIRGVNFVDYGTALTTYHDMAAVNMTLGWKLEDVRMQNSGGWAAVQMRGSGAVVDQTTITASPYNAIHATGACCTEVTYGAPGQLKGLQVTNSVISGNNTAKHDPGWEAVTKFMQTDDLLVDNVESYGNYGPGLWLDWQNYRYTIRNSNFHDNKGTGNNWQGQGILLEIYSDDGAVQGNKFSANTGPDLVLSSSSRVDVSNNVFQGSSTDTGAQIEFHRGKADGACARPAPTAVQVHNNQFLDWGGPWGWAAIETTNDSARSWSCAQAASPVAAGHMFDFNTYRKASYAGPLVGWEGTNAASVSAEQSMWGYEKGTTAPAPTTTAAPTTTSTTAPASAGPSSQTTGTDTTAPSAKITSPTNGSTLPSSATVKGTGSDNRAVTKMELYIDGKRKTTTSSGSLAYTWSPSKGSHTLVLKAYDSAGNVGQSTVSVNR